MRTATRQSMKSVARLGITVAADRAWKKQKAKSPISLKQIVKKLM
jgi:hypothetical protein